MKATAKAPSNIAFIKYWGKRDERLRLPLNSSVSMNLDRIYTVTTVEFSKRFEKDVFVLKGAKTTEKEKQRVFKHLDRVRRLAGITTRAKVVSENNFPKGTGLSSSASGFAALSLAAATAAGLRLSEKELSCLARLGSGSACRSIPDGFVEWKKGRSHSTSYAYSLFPPQYWQLYDVVAVVSREEKRVSTTEGHALARTSPFLKERVRRMPAKIRRLKEYLKKREFERFGQLCEQEALEMHAVMISSWPALLYWTPETLELMKRVVRWREEGVGVYFTINTGQDCHLLTLRKWREEVERRLRSLRFVKRVIVNRPGVGARLLKSHLF